MAHCIIWIKKKNSKAHTANRLAFQKTALNTLFRSKMKLLFVCPKGENTPTSGLDTMHQHLHSYTVIEHVSPEEQHHMHKYRYFTKCGLMSVGKSLCVQSAHNNSPSKLQSASTDMT